MSSKNSPSVPKSYKITASVVIFLGVTITIMGIIAVMINTMGVAVCPIGLVLIIAGLKTWRNGATRFATITAFVFAAFFGSIFGAIANDGMDSIAWTIGVLIVALAFLAWGLMLLRGRTSSQVTVASGDNI